MIFFSVQEHLPLWGGGSPDQAKIKLCYEDKKEVWSILLEQPWQTEGGGKCKNIHRECLAYVCDSKPHLHSSCLRCKSIYGSGALCAGQIYSLLNDYIKEHSDIQTFKTFSIKISRMWLSDLMTTLLNPAMVCWAQKLYISITFP